MSTVMPKKAGKQANKASRKDEDIEMWANDDDDDPEGSRSPSTPKASNSQRDAPERSWAAQIDRGMWDFDNSPERPLSSRAGSSSPSPPERPQKSDFGTALASTFLRAPEAAERGERAFWDLHSLDGIRVCAGLLDTYLEDAVAFQHVVIDHHANLVRTRNLVRKSLDAISRAIYLRGKQDALRNLDLETERG